MPNLSPRNVRKKYMLYDNKICTGDEAAQCIECLKKKIGKIRIQNSCIQRRLYKIGKDDL